MTFVHFYYKGKTQRLYFDESNNYMLERLNHPRIFMYKKELANENTNRIRWILIKRFNKYPENLENHSGFLRCLSPGFDYYMDLNEEDHVYIIRNTFTNQ